MSDIRTLPDSVKVTLLWVASVVVVAALLYLYVYAIESFVDSEIVEWLALIVGSLALVAAAWGIARLTDKVLR